MSDQNNEILIDLIKSKKVTYHIRNLCKFQTRDKTQTDSMQSDSASATSYESDAALATAENPSLGFRSFGARANYL